MPSYSRGGGVRQPFGQNEFLHSTVGVKYTPYTIAAATVAIEKIDGIDQKVLQPGEVLAKITSGDDAGKVGPFQAGATDGRQTLANIVGVNSSWFPWQLMEADREVSVAYDAAVKQAWCFERDAAGLRVPLSNTTAAAMTAQKSMNILFK